MRALFLSLSLAFACTSAADTLVVDNVNGYTLTDGGIHKFGALQVKDGRVVATGAAGAFSGIDADRRVDGRGRTLLPGLTDAHGHVMGQGYLQADLNLSGITSKAQALARIKAYAEATPQAKWIRGRGWNQELWPDRAFPSASDLDTVVADRPVWLRRVDGHAGWANSLALELAGIDADTDAPEGGQIGRTAAGEADGILVDNAMSLVEAKIPGRSREEQRVALDRALAQLASLGLTGVHDAGVDFDTLALYQQRDGQDALPLRIYAMLSDVETLNRVAAPYMGDHLVARSVKLYADGALGSRGAALLDDYSDRKGHRGLLIHPVAELKQRIKTVIDRGFQVNVHAIGDRGNREVLKAIAQYGKPQQRNRIEHLQVVAAEDFSAIRSAGIIASMQPTHATSDMNMAEDRLGPERIHGAYAWRTVLDAGIPLAGGSDFPIESANPFWGLYAAIARQDHQGQPAKGWYPAQALSREEALHAFTLGAAYAAFQEEKLGSLEPGKAADFVLVDRDYFRVPVHEIWQTRVLATYLEGEPVFIAEEFAR
ncbi:amidohydrolase [Ferrimonas sediminicola]|uniref:Amidohydrolase n=1 Tax=Ferrimonas sediminicola TaxID=2569538 RepID=A0A4U1BGE7_9GAMM|nr:amidohydrolase [Ferrimonas sediminicola]TKB50251.1 amidohydrolase [Ferrimonas sediminicola]